MAVYTYSSTVASTSVPSRNESMQMKVFEFRAGSSNISTVINIRGSPSLSSGWVHLIWQVVAQEDGMNGECRTDYVFSQILQNSRPPSGGRIGREKAQEHTRIRGLPAVEARTSSKRRREGKETGAARRLTLGPDGNWSREPRCQKSICSMSSKQSRSADTRCSVRELNIGPEVDLQWMGSITGDEGASEEILGTATNLVQFLKESVRQPAKTFHIYVP
ncbi:hypothetical protein FIBSPDRAFT_936097 [Athelia psychrophila]|uniref:Uncharacterized protein n=1 Tax=Athelia psychrophila TaxID=1759441 RepID=A0A166CPU3_9AGAM|nr:hypothetical protein FIBSPDRAFT_936097 [Fibularhizoctonia sp. CBS 109695]